MKRRSGIKVMGQLIGLVVPLLHVMLAAIFLGVAGFLCAIFLTILAGTALMYLDTPAIVAIHIKILIVFAVLRGILHYAEHLIMVFFIGRYHIYAGIWAFVSCLLVGVGVPLWNGRKSGSTGMEFRSGIGELNSYVLNSLRGLEETIQYGQEESRKTEMSKKSVELLNKQKELNRMEGNTRALTNFLILLSSFGMLFFTFLLYEKQQMSMDAVVLCTISMMGSFGPVVALSNLSNNLNQTLASGERVLSILEEAPKVEEVFEKKEVNFENASCEHVTFSYEDEVILRDYSICLPKGKIIGIHGKSGSGKSNVQMKNCTGERIFCQQAFPVGSKLCKCCVNLLVAFEIVYALLGHRQRNREYFRNKCKGYQYKKST